MTCDGSPGKPGMVCVGGTLTGYLYDRCSGCRVCTPCGEPARSPATPPSPRERAEAIVGGFGGFDTTTHRYLVRDITAAIEEAVREEADIRDTVTAQRDALRGQLAQAERERDEARAAPCSWCGDCLQTEVRDAWKADSERSA